MKRFFVGLGVAALAGVTGAAAFLLVSGRGSVAEDGQALAGRSVFVEVPKVLTGAGEVSRFIYLNREGATLAAGVDDARDNRSSLVKSAGAERADIPAFRGSHAQWTRIVGCVAQLFAPYDVRVVDRRPVGQRYVMAVIGGTPEDLGGDPTGDSGHAHALTGLAPYTGDPIPDAVVLAFSRELGRRTRPVCETAAMEIAHAYGLDHSYNCKDVMSYLRPCGRRSFRDEVKPCGEHEPRACKNGDPTQNSHARLADVLGLGDG